MAEETKPLLNDLMEMEDLVQVSKFSEVFPEVPPELDEDHDDLSEVNSIPNSIPIPNSIGMRESRQEQILAGPPDKFVLDFNQTIKKSLLFDPKNPNKMIQDIVAAFNQGRQSIMIPSDVLGTRINKDQLRLVARNNQPELIPPTENKMYKKVFLTGKTEEIGVFKQTDLYISAHGSHIINVPQGMVAKCWLGNQPVFYGPGHHVVHDQNLKKVDQNNLVKLSCPYVNHGNYHIIRVPPGKLACIWIDSKAYFLKAREEPYVFNHPVFQFDQPMVNMNSDYIHHGTFHILRIPEGRIAKVWFGNRPQLLESKPEPYIFNDPQFNLIRKNDDMMYEFADAEVIVHGPIKRLLPRTGNVAITYNNGKLFTYGPTGKPILITSPTHSFDGFLPINIQTLEFPSVNTREERVAQNEGDPDHLNYEIFRTSDGLPIGVKLLVVYEIANPDATLHKLNQNQILPHIEKLVVADMGMVIQNCNSADFLRSNQTQARPTNQYEGGDGFAPSAPEFYEHLQDEVKNKLHDDFAEYGIKLVRLNVETPKILDKSISGKMAEFSLMNSQARAKESVLDRNFNIAKQEAIQKAKTIEIEQQQFNTNQIAQAQAELDAARLKAQAVKIEAEGQAAADLAKAKVEIEKQRMALELAKERGKLYSECPELLKFDLAEAQVRAMKGINGMVISPEVAANYYGFGVRVPEGGLFQNKEEK